MVKNISILGSTGSIGTQTLEVVRYNKDIKVTALAAGSNVDLIEKQIREFKPEIACLWSEEKAKELKERTEIKKKLKKKNDRISFDLATNLPDSFAGVPLILTGWQGLIG